MSRVFHVQQHFDDLINSTENIAAFYLEYASHYTQHIDGTACGKPCPVYETIVNVVFKDEEAKCKLAPYMRDYKVLSQTTIQISLYFPNPLEFKDFACYKTAPITKRWAEYDGNSI
jgi:hypothetical protein